MSLGKTYTNPRLEALDIVNPYAQVSSTLQDNDSGHAGWDRLRSVLFLRPLYLGAGCPSTHYRSGGCLRGGASGWVGPRYRRRWEWWQCDRFRRQVCGGHGLCRGYGDEQCPRGAFLYPFERWPRPGGRGG